MANILDAIANIIDNYSSYDLNQVMGKNRANSMGVAFEEYVKAAFANAIGLDQNSKNIKFNECFSYLGNTNNPPDIMIRNGDAIEVKKAESKFAGLALNSSYPKSKIYADSKMLTNACKKSEEWIEKDIIYVIGFVKNNKVLAITMVYGIDYAASSEIYEKITHTIITGIKSINDLEIAETNELGRVNKVDPLGITYLRIRGMWHIENPLKVFDYIYTPPKQSRFELMVVINLDKYKQMPEISRKRIESNNHIKVSDVQIKNPDNPARLKDAKLLTYCL